jgi:hypothetical protein
MNCSPQNTQALQCSDTTQHQPFGGLRSQSEYRGGDKKKFMSLPETKPQCPVLDQPLHSHDDDDDEGDDNYYYYYYYYYYHDDDDDYDDDDDDTTAKLVVLVKSIPSSKLTGQ